MKKFGILLICCMVLTGCGSKTLTCSKTENKESLKTEEKVIITYNKQMKTIEHDMKVSLKNSYEDYIDIVTKSLNDSLKKYKNKKGISVKSVKNKDNVVVSLKFDGSKMDDSGKKLAGFDTSKSFNNMKKELEKKGYTCK